MAFTDLPHFLPTLKALSRFFLETEISFRHASTIGEFRFSLLVGLPVYTHLHGYWKRRKIPPPPPSLTTLLADSPSLPSDGEGGRGKQLETGGGGGGENAKEVSLPSRGKRDSSSTQLRGEGLSP